MSTTSTLETQAPRATTVAGDVSNASAGALVVEVLDLVAELTNPISQARSEWQALFDRDPDSNIFHHPEGTLAELPYLPQSRLGARLILCRRDGQVVGLAGLLPKVSRTRYVGGVGPNWVVHGYRLIGNRFLCSGDRTIAAVLLEAANREVVRQGAKYLLIEDVDQSSHLYELAQECQRKGYGLYSPTSFQERLKIQLPATSQEYFSKFSSKTRSTFRRKEKKLGAIRLFCCTQVDHVADFLRDAHDISVHTWQTEQFGLRVKNDAAELAQFTFLASHGALRSYLLYRDEKPLAFIIGNQHRGLYRYEEVGFDRRQQGQSPGQTLLIKVLEDMFSRETPQVFDFGMGDADYKRLFANLETRAGNIWLVPPGLPGKGLVTYLNASRSVRQWGRKAIKLAGWYRALRQKSRQGAVKPDRSADPASETDESA